MRRITSSLRSPNPIDLAARVRSRSHNNLKSNKTLYGSLLVSRHSDVQTNPPEPLAAQLQALRTAFQELKSELGPLRREVMEMRSAVGSFTASSSCLLAGLTADLQSDIQANLTALQQETAREDGVTEALSREVKSLSADIRHVRKAIRQFGKQVTDLEAFVGVEKRSI